jgi:hypothetical protein
MGKLFIDCKNLLDPSQSKKWTITRALDSGSSPKRTNLVTNSMAASFGSLDSIPLRTRDCFGPRIIGHNMCDRDIRHGVVDFKHLVP